MGLKLQARLAREQWVLWPVFLLGQLLVLYVVGQPGPELVMLAGYVSGGVVWSTDNSAGDLWRYLVTRADPRPRFLQRTWGLSATLGAFNALLWLLVDALRRGALRPESVSLAVAFVAAFVWRNLEASAWLSGGRHWGSFLLRHLPFLVLPGAVYLAASQHAGWRWELVGGAMLLRMAWLYWRLTGRELRSSAAQPAQ